MEQRDGQRRCRWRTTSAGCAALGAVVVLAGCATASETPGGSASAIPESRTPAVLPEVTAQVAATVETQPVRHGGDAADDPAVWVHPTDPAMSAIVATDKKGGLLVYDLSGRELQYLAVGDMNNVDVRSGDDGFILGGRAVPIVAAGNRSDNTLGVFALDPDTRQLRDVAADAIEPELEVYGSCLYRSADTGSLYAFVNSKKGEVEQWELTDDGSGRVHGERVRAFGVQSQTEGCVADDELGHLYLGEEATGIWKFGAGPGDGDTGTLIAEVSPSGPLVGQVEGLTLSYAPDGGGYLFASSQGSSSYAVYERRGNNAYVGTFRITPDNGIDGAEDTDGIDVSAADLGPSFPSGVFVAQDGANDDGAQNFKLVPLERILSG